ncbi:hypothetical protein HIM_05573 [Hirsutella minnesotensis 3608]|uniref:Uncharacterized protein n=1 Tax=Hirsutella minnesotensis 3608 TaxID=1043627 RepID=A0A0F8A057_9HYPO|nr:hypothetical protein HIM_05573 [Hirsutella minnesotensis 3608]
MATDAISGRRRTNSSSASLQRSGQARKPSNQVIQPKSSHTSDEFLQDFLSPSFDPAAFLNSRLSPLEKRQGPGQGGAEPVSLSELSAQAQALLLQLNAQTTRLSNTLTQLTDDILRSGSRLAYEVELLRGETLSLSETLHETLHDDIKHFVPDGLQPGSSTTGAAEPAAAEGAQDTEAGEADDPSYIKQLRTLTLVRSRLEAVIKTFGDAMDFVFPPSEVSVSSSFLSVSAPEPGAAQQSSEEKGQQVLKQLRDEISGLLHSGEDPVRAIEQAATRVEQLKELASVWKGTAEEKGRSKFIESLAKMVEDRHRELMRELEQQQQAAKKEGKTSAESPAAKRLGTAREAATAEDARTQPGGFGLINQLQKLRSGL